MIAKCGKVLSMFCVSLWFIKRFKPFQLTALRFRMQSRRHRFPSTTGLFRKISGLNLQNQTQTDQTGTKTRYLPLKFTFFILTKPQDLTSVSPDFLFSCLFTFPPASVVICFLLPSFYFIISRFYFTWNRKRERKVKQKEEKTRCCEEQGGKGGAGRGKTEKEKQTERGTKKEWEKEEKIKGRWKRTRGKSKTKNRKMKKGGTKIRKSRKRKNNNPNK